MVDHISPDLVSPSIQGINIAEEKPGEKDKLQS